MITLIVKGDRRKAVYSAKLHGIDAIWLASVQELEQRLHCGDMNQGKVMFWFMQDVQTIPGYGYPDGTLLHFQMGMREGGLL